MWAGTCPRLTARKRRNCIQNRSTKVSATCANTGISMACIDIGKSPLVPRDCQRDGLRHPYTLDFRQGSARAWDTRPPRPMAGLFTSLLEVQLTQGPGTALTRPNFRESHVYGGRNASAQA